MLQPATLTFLRQLKKNNDKAWFDANHKVYETAKADFEDFIETLLKAVMPLDPAFAAHKAKDCTYRIFRDVRFSKDKTPYKAHFGAFFSRAGASGTARVIICTSSRAPSLPAADCGCRRRRC